MLTAYEGAAQTRYFMGVKGDKSRQGFVFLDFSRHDVTVADDVYQTSELFGLK